MISRDELEKRLRPNAYSTLGFIGLNESFEDILEQDQLTLQKLGISYERISDELEKIIATALEQKQKLMQTNSKEFFEREHHSIKWLGKPAPTFSINSLPNTKIGFIVDTKYQVFFIQFRGFQSCPWGCEHEGWGSFDFLLLNRENGQYITAPGLIVHLIRAHHFFEGIESPYRVDPYKLAQVLGLTA